MIDYIYRNHKTGMEIKRTRRYPIKEGKGLLQKAIDKSMGIPSGYKLHQTVDYRTSAKERKAK